MSLFRRLLQRDFFLTLKTNARFYGKQTSAWDKEYLEQLWMRRQILGPDEPKPRSEHRNWNYDAEVFAFGSRLKEKFTMSTLKRAFLFRCKLEQDVETRRNIVDDANVPNLSLEHNENFVQRGKEITSVFTRAFLRKYFKLLPEEAIVDVSNELCSLERINQLSRDIGTYDLIKSIEFPLEPETLYDSFFSIIGALEHDTDLQTAEQFVQDFILTQLNDIDVNEIFNVSHPEILVESLLNAQKRGKPEPRMVRQAGSFTVTPVYIVGIFSDKQLIGQSPGESIKIAREMAYRDSLRNLFQTNTENQQVYNFSTLNIVDEWKNRENAHITGFLPENFLLEKVDAVEPEPLCAREMVAFYKNTVEPSLGTVLRRKLKHQFYKGTPMRRVPRSFIKPKVETI